MSVGAYLVIYISVALTSPHIQANPNPNSLEVELEGGSLCAYNGRTYPEGDRWVDDEDPCVQYLCLQGEAVAGADPQCLGATTSPPTEEPPLYCTYNGRQYAEGERWEDESDPCVEYWCSHGKPLTVPKPNCPTTTPSTTTPPPVYCTYNGRQYAEGERWEDESDPCVEYWCSQGKPLTVTKPNCPASTPPPVYCSHQGVRYGEGDRIPNYEMCVRLICHDGYVARYEVPQCRATPTCTYLGTEYQPDDVIPSSDACYQITCRPDGQVAHTLLPYCRTTTPPTTPPPTTRPQVCYYEGEEYDVGETVPTTDRCVEYYCTTAYSLVRREKTNCYEPMKCNHQGRTYQEGDEVMRVGCWVTACGSTGQLERRREEGCTTTTTTSGGCEYNGRTYSMGENAETRREGNKCYYKLCGYDGQLHGWTETNCQRNPNTHYRPQPYASETGFPCHHVPAGRYADPSSCSHFWVCVRVPQMTCPYGQRWSQQYNRCRPAGKVQCSATSGAEFSCEGKVPGNTYPNPQDCTKYYQCPVHNVFKCPLGTLWDSKINACNHANQVSCDVVQYSD